jgi:putative DNA primase/helicase
LTFIFNDGERLYGDSSGAFIYQSKAALDMGLDVAPASAETRTAMFSAASEMSFETQADCARLLAWCAISPFCGALPWRPAGYLTGESGVGKSTILDMVVNPLAKPLYFSGASTEAGVRQTVGNDCLPTVIDELEFMKNEDNNTRRAFGILDLVRQSTSNDSPPIVKGTMSGRAMSFATHCQYLLAGISPGLERQADTSRFFTVDLVKPDGNAWPRVKSKAESLFTPPNCAAVRAFVWPRIDEILRLADAMIEPIRDASGFDTRYAKLEGILFAAHWVVWKSKRPEEAELAEWLSKVYDTKPPEVLDNDADTIINRLLTAIVQAADAPQKYTVGQMALALSKGVENDEISLVAEPLSPEKEERFRRTLNLYGLYIMPRTGQFSIARGRPELARIMGTTTQYARVLSRHTLCTDKDKVVNALGEVRRCMVFSASILEGEPPF